MPRTKRVERRRHTDRGAEGPAQIAPPALGLLALRWSSRRSRGSRSPWRPWRPWRPCLRCALRLLIAGRRAARERRAASGLLLQAPVSAPVSAVAQAGDWRRSWPQCSLRQSPRRRSQRLSPKSEPRIWASPIHGRVSTRSGDLSSFGFLRVDLFGLHRDLTWAWACSATQARKSLGKVKAGTSRRAFAATGEGNSQGTPQ